MSIKEEIKQLGLKVPDCFWTRDEATLAMMTGGCGPGKYGDYLVPDTAWGLSIKLACVAHDYMYAIGLYLNDKEKADLWFLLNMLKIVNTKSKNKTLKVLRRYRVMSYYSAVAEVGGKSFSKAAEKFDISNIDRL